MKFCPRCKNCGWYWYEHDEASDDDPEDTGHITGYKFSVAKCPEFELSVKDQQLEDRGAKQVTLDELNREDDESSMYWGCTVYIIPTSRGSIVAIGE